MSIATDSASKTIAVRGSLDLATSVALCAEIEQLSEMESERIVVDLRTVESADPSGVRALMGAAREAAILTCRLVVAIAPGSDLDRLITLVGAREFLHIVDAAPTAVAAGE